MKGINYQDMQKQKRSTKQYKKCRCNVRGMWGAGAAPTQIRGGPSEEQAGSPNQQKPSFGRQRSHSQSQLCPHELGLLSLALNTVRTRLQGAANHEGWNSAW